MRIAGQKDNSSSILGQDKTESKDPAQRKKEFIRRRRHQADQDGAATKVIQGMSKVAKDAFNKSQSVEMDDETEKTALGQLSWKVFSCYGLF